MRAACYSPLGVAPSFWYGPTEVACAVANLGVQRVALSSNYPATWEPTVMLDKDGLTAWETSPG